MSKVTHIEFTEDLDLLELLDRVKEGETIILDMTWDLLTTQAKESIAVILPYELYQRIKNHGD